MAATVVVGDKSRVIEEVAPTDEVTPSFELAVAYHRSHDVAVAGGHDVERARGLTTVACGLATNARYMGLHGLAITHQQSGLEQ